MVSGPVCHGELEWSTTWRSSIPFFSFISSAYFLEQVSIALTIIKWRTAPHVSYWAKRECLIKRLVFASESLYIWSVFFLWWGPGFEQVDFYTELVSELGKSSIVEVKFAFESRADMPHSLHLLTHAHTHCYSWFFILLPINAVHLDYAGIRCHHTGPNNSVAYLRRSATVA